ncbi:hypothetical protein KDH_25010 [Dictyobacter sp. S3.2.2.5]|uniref:Gfo/Idh/MocA-like oxidoreductase N-terminal domain-containing protein n=1 Tax=Dictyobacter halimunensis TaxID=3026934 RepID=A0ABQ6FTB3_9CHLR|nr:hypothetical protein KDH_25010 [Dictyobacter sp. S3.2.2.5]
MQRRIVFGIIGGGWRSTFFVQIARALPQRFHISGVVVRDAEKGAQFEQQWDVPTFRTLDDLLNAGKLDFVVLSVPWATTPVLMHELSQRQIPVLAETPPAPDVEGLRSLRPLIESGAKVQVAEQYQFQPLHAARLRLVQEGRLGQISQVQISVAHGYHGISLLRQFLGVGFALPTITARPFESPLIASPDRSGPPTQEEIQPSRQVMAELDFGERLGIYDFCDDQYFSWVRSPRLLVRGERGEINNREVRYLRDVRTPISFELQRQSAGEYGNLEGYYLKGIMAGSEWIYQNPFIPGRLSDDEIAIATCLEKMAIYVDEGVEFYGLAEASQDHYLSIMIQEAVKSGRQQPTGL